MTSKIWCPSTREPQVPPGDLWFRMHKQSGKMFHGLRTHIRGDTLTWYHAPHDVLSLFVSIFPQLSVTCFFKGSACVQQDTEGKREGKDSEKKGWMSDGWRCGFLFSKNPPDSLWSIDWCVECVCEFASSLLMMLHPSHKRSPTGDSTPRVWDELQVLLKKPAGEVEWKKPDREFLFLFPSRNINLNSEKESSNYRNYQQHVFQTRDFRAVAWPGSHWASFVCMFDVCLMCGLRPGLLFLSPLASSSSRRPVKSEGGSQSNKTDNTHTVHYIWKPLAFFLTLTLRPESPV